MIWHVDFMDLIGTGLVIAGCIVYGALHLTGWALKRIRKSHKNRDPYYR